jgi:uncharacterized protein (TIGR03435 family)
MTRQVFLLAMAATGWAHGPVFEVASVRPAGPAVKRTDIRRDPAGGISAMNVSLRTLIVLAYNIQDFQISGAPGWIGSERYNVVARAPAGARKSETWAMLRALLEERFHLVVHRETKETAVYELTVAKSGLKIQEARRAPGETDDWCRQGSGHLQCYLLPVGDLALTLAGILKRPVVDRTGIVAKFDLTLDWSPDNAPGDGPSIFTAIQEQLGMRLESAKGPLEMVVVDRVEKAEGN